MMPNIADILLVLLLLACSIINSAENAEHHHRIRSAKEGLFKTLLQQLIDNVDTFKMSMIWWKLYIIEMKDADLVPMTLI